MTVECACCGRSLDETSSVRLHRRSDVKICFDCLNGLNMQRDRHMSAHSGGWFVTGHEPVFVVSDMPRAIDHYTKLGFEVSPYDEGYAFAEHGRLNLHLERFDGSTGPPGGGVLYIHCDDADAVAAEWRKAGLDVEAPENKPWGKNEGSHVDPDGNVIRFGSPRRD